MFADNFTANSQTQPATVCLESHIGLEGLFQYSPGITGTTVADLDLQPFPASLGNQPGAYMYFCLLTRGYGLGRVDNQVM